MKYLITESQFDKVIFKYLDNQDFIKIEKKTEYILLIQKVMNMLKSGVIKMIGFVSLVTS